MFSLNLQKESFDLIWSEGAIYIIGFERGLREWKECLGPKGYMVVTDIAWIKDDPPLEIRRYWEREYPSIMTIDQHLSLIESCGYRLVEHFNLPESAWWDDFENRDKKLLSFVFYLRYLIHSKLNRKKEKAMKNPSHPLPRVKLSILFCLCLGLCLAVGQAQVMPGRPRKAALPRKGDKVTTSTKAAIVLTDNELRAYELKRMAQDKQRLREWANKIASTTGEDLDSWQYAEEYQRFIEDLKNAKAQVLWSQTADVDIPNPPSPSLKALNALKEINDRDKQLQEQAEAEKKEREKKQKEAALKEAQLKKQQEEEMKKRAEEAAKQKPQTEE